MRMYRCQYCTHRVIVDKQAKGKHSAKWKMGNHYETQHKHLLPPDMDGYRWFYYLLTKKSQGSCVMCKQPTDFNYSTMKYSRFCNNPACKQKYKEERDRRMIGKYGKLYLTDDPEVQKKMQANRKISGTYTWSDGKTRIPYVGTYELHFLKYLDTELKWPASDIVAPSPHTYTYECDGKKHFYMPDFFIPSIATEIEIKSSERMEYQNPESRAKEIAKDALMRSCANQFQYIIIFDKQYDAFLKLIQNDSTN